MRKRFCYECEDTGEIIIYHSENGNVQPDVRLEKDIVVLLKQILRFAQDDTQFCHSEERSDEESKKSRIFATYFKTERKL